MEQSRKTLIKNFLKKYAKKKRTWILLAFAILILFFVLKPANNSANVVMDTARLVDLKQTVLATGQVTSSTDLDLSFNSSGIVKSLKVKTGDVVKKGDVLASIDQGSELAALTQARGALQAAQARYKKILTGSSSESINLAQVNLDQTKISEDVAVKNAYHNLLNSTPEALPESQDSTDFEAPTISGTYNGSKEGTIYMETYLSTNGGSSFALKGLTEGNGIVATNIAQPLGNSGLYIKFPNTTETNVRNWVINIPNKKAANYLTNYNAYQSALSHGDQAVSQKTAELALQKAQAQAPDLDLARADITSAEGTLQAAQSKFEDTIIRAPADGTITNVDVKLGELSEVQKPVITLQDVSNLYIEAKINESSIANIKLGQKVTMTFDAFGSDKKFDGVVVHIDPSAVTNDGIVNYKIKTSITNLDPGIRSGMNADISVLTAEKPQVIVIPKAAIVSADGGMSVNIVTDKKHSKYTKVPVTVGLLGDGNLIEIKTGLTDGQDIAIISK